MSTCSTFKECEGHKHCKVRVLKYGLGFHNNAYEVYCGKKLPCEDHGMQGTRVIYPTLNCYRWYGVTTIHAKDLRGLPHLQYIIIDGQKITRRKKA